VNFFALSGSVQFPLPEPVKLVFRADKDAPADRLSAAFVFSPAAGVTGLQIVEKDGSTFFDGIVDEQIQSGDLLTLSCRSRAALLLDNEALPQEYAAPSLGLIFERHLKPYGFTAFRGNGAVFSSAFSVTKGMSEWQAAEAFCKQFLKVTPRAVGTVFDASGEISEVPVRFGGIGGIRYSSLTVRHEWSKAVTEVYAKTGNTYTLAAEDPDVKALGVVRRRFLSKADSDAAALLKAAQTKTLELVLDCPGKVPAALSAPAAVCDPALGSFENLAVAGLRQERSSGGEHCIVTLRRN
jgi:hypothetical protein